MDRLLSDEEITELHKWLLKDETACAACIKRTAKAQLVKADADWVKWIEEVMGDNCHETKCNYWHDCPDGMFDVACLKWQERKKEIGL